MLKNCCIGHAPSLTTVVCSVMHNPDYDDAMMKDWDQEDCNLVWKE
jgi:hypothetical protein